jgi:hypothetical protein
MSALMAFSHVLTMALALQNPPVTAPIPADPPIGGPVWTLAVPTVLFVGSFLGTYLLYRRFSQVEEE